MDQGPLVLVRLPRVCDLPGNAEYWQGFGVQPMGKEPTVMSAGKTIVFIAAVLMTLPGTVRADRHMPTLPMAEKPDDGMYAQEWLYKSSLDLRRDLAATEKEGKRLVIFWEQVECPNCTSMYEINLRIPRLVEKIKKNFNVIKLDILGERQVTGLDGAVLAEKDLASTNKIYYTPTLQFLPDSLELAAGGKDGVSEVFRPEGYFKPYHFYFLFHYVQSKGYESEPSFQRWLAVIGKDMQARNITYDLWADSLPPDLLNQY
jgi:thioredoxin-related protein